MYQYIAPYYEKIFPYKQSIFRFLDKHLPLGSVKDVACGTGNYATKLQNTERTVYASDLSEEMISHAKEHNSNVTFFVEDMSLMHPNQSYNGIYIIGNSLVHATTMKEITLILRSLYNQLSNGGTLIIQIVNYDRILEQSITKLPEIVDKDMVFKRHYYFDHLPLIRFETILQVQKYSYQSDVLLFPLKKQELEHSLQTVGFTIENCYGSYDEDPYIKNSSFHTIMVCTK